MIRQKFYMQPFTIPYDKVTGNISDREQSEFNMAISYLGRLNALFFQADEAALQLDAYTWFHSLLVLFRELSTEMKPDEIKTFDQKRIIIAGYVNKHVIETKTGRSKGLSPELYDKLHSYEMDLRDIMRKTGLQMKIKDSAMNALR